MQIKKVENYYNTDFRGLKFDREVSVIKSAFSSKIKRFPKDYEYIKKLGESVGLNSSELYRLNPVIGMEELSSHLQNAEFSSFNPLDIINTPTYSTNQLEKLAETNFRFNLHLHTENSDGKMSVKDLLDKAVEYSSIVKSKTPNKPFIFAITDHDTLEGSKEAVRLIASNPLKYKDISIVLGAELSAIYQNPHILNRPFTFEMVAYSINPFNEELNKSLEYLRSQRIELSKKIITDANEIYPQLNFSYEEACQKSKNPLKGIDGFLYSLANYFTEKAGSFGIETDNNRLCYTYLPALTKQVFKIYHEAGEIFQNIGDNFGFLGIAHPGKIKLGAGSIRQDFIDKCHSEQTNTGQRIMEIFINFLKEIGKNKFNGIEINYQAYEGKLKEAQDFITSENFVGVDKKGAANWLMNFKLIAKKLNLLETGGLDTHSENPFMRK